MKNPQKLAFISLIIILCISLLLLTNIINIFGQRNFLHPDDYEYYFFGQNILKEGSLEKKIEIQDIGVSKSVFCNQDFTLYKDNYCIPTRAIGYDFIIFISLFISKYFYSFILSFISIILVIYFFLFSKRITKNLSYTLISITIFIFSFPFIYWSNINISNMCATLFFLVGLYYTFLYKNKLVLSSIFLSSSIFIRHEFILFIFPIFLFINVYYLIIKRKFYGRDLIIFNIIFFVILFGVLYFNNNYYGDPLIFGYVSHQATLEINSNSLNYKLGLLDQFKLIISERMTQMIKIQDWYFNNLVFWVFGVITFPLTIFGIIGIILYSNKNKKFFYFILLLILLSQLFLQGIHWGYDQGWSGTPYIRYLLPGYIFLIIFSCLFIKNLKINKKYILISLILISLILSTTNLALAPTGLFESVDTMKKNYDLNNELNHTISDRSIIITNIFDKTLLNTDIKTINPKRSNLSIEDLNNLSRLLLDKNYDLYIINAPWHKNSYINTTQMNLKVYVIKENDYYQLIRISD